MNRDYIAILLHHYRDVCEGLYANPRGEDGVGRFLMCETWNHPAYQELERLLTMMHERWPRLRQAVRVRYERYSEHRVAWCKRCGEHPASAIKSIHSHPPGRSVTLRPRMVRVFGADDDPLAVADAEEWLQRHWRERYDRRFHETSLVIPKTIAEIEAERALREAA
jgi:hypothetical protein